MSSTLKDFALVFLGGGVGSSVRYLMTVLFTVVKLKTWMATLLVNIVGAMVMLILSYKYDLNADSSKFIKTGMLGGLTTFSTFSLEVVSTFRSGLYLEAGLILFLNIVFGIIVGIWIFR